jgi:hypothetical protein
MRGDMFESFTRTAITRARFKPNKCHKKLPAVIGKVVSVCQAAWSAVLQVISAIGKQHLIWLNNSVVRVWLSNVTQVCWYLLCCTCDGKFWFCHETWAFSLHVKPCYYPISILYCIVSYCIVLLAVQCVTKWSVLNMATGWRTRRTKLNSSDFQWMRYGMSHAVL